MGIKIDSSKAKAIEHVSYGLNGDIGGIPRTTYYTPDGRKIEAIPSIREFVVKDSEGKIIKTGTRDANLDKGWLLTPPTRKRKYCPGCDRWHDNQRQIDACVLQSKRFIQTATKKVQQEETDENTQLKKQISDLEARLNKLMEAKGG